MARSLRSSLHSRQSRRRAYLPIGRQPLPSSTQQQPPTHLARLPHLHLCHHLPRTTRLTQHLKDPAQLLRHRASTSKERVSCRIRSRHAWMPTRRQPNGSVRIGAGRCPASPLKSSRNLGQIPSWLEGPQATTVCTSVVRRAQGLRVRVGLARAPPALAACSLSTHRVHGAERLCTRHGPEAIASL